MSIVWGIVAFGVIIVLLYAVTLAKQAERARRLREDLEEWEGVEDVRRSTRDKLDDDPEYRNRVRDHFND